MHAAGDNNFIGPYICSPVIYNLIKFIYTYGKLVAHGCRCLSLLLVLTSASAGVYTRELLEQKFNAIVLCTSVQ